MRRPGNQGSRCVGLQSDEWLIFFELESWRDDHYIYEYAENTLRKKFLDNLPVGCTKSEIERMTPAELIDLDLELQDHGREHDRIRKYDDYDIIN